MAQFLETAMLILFGCSWPFNIVKSIRSRTAKGRSAGFMYLIMLGYLCGIASKIAAGNVTYVVVFYVLDLVMVMIDCTLYWRNRRLDAQAEREACSAAGHGPKQ